MKIKSRECITHMQWLRKTWQLNGFKVIYAKPNQLKRRREISDNSYVQKKTKDPFLRTILWIFVKHAKNFTGITKDPLRTDSKHVELQSEL